MILNLTKYGQNHSNYSKSDSKWYSSSSHQSHTYLVAKVNNKTI